MTEELPPTDDRTPKRAHPIVPDSHRFPCERCGHMNECPPIAYPLRPPALARPESGGIVARELLPPPGDETIRQS